MEVTKAVFFIMLLCVALLLRARYMRSLEKLHSKYLRNFDLTNKEIAKLKDHGLI